MEVNPSQWNRFHVWGLGNGRKPYLSYTIIVESSKLNTPKLSKYQVSLYQNICDLRFDENLTWKQVANRLNGLGYTSTRGGKKYILNSLFNLFQNPKTF